ncbi:MAG: hypothetical protein Q9225_004612 [Loekoesia sp. 1 TL-2023]
MASTRHRPVRPITISIIFLALFLAVSQTTPTKDFDQTALARQPKSINLTSSIPEERDLKAPTTALLPINASNLIFNSFHQLVLVSRPIISTILDHIVAWSKESVFSGRPIADTFFCAKGALEFAVISLNKVSIPWEAIQSIAHWVNERVLKGLVGFFEVYWEVIKGFWVLVMFGIPPHKYWWHMEDMDNL